MGTFISLLGGLILLFILLLIVLAILDFLFDLSKLFTVFKIYFYKDKIIDIPAKTLLVEQLKSTAKDRNDCNLKLKDLYENAGIKELIDQIDHKKTTYAQLRQLSKEIFKKSNDYLDDYADKKLKKLFQPDEPKETNTEGTVHEVKS